MILKKTPSRGFSVIELLVSVAIMTIISTVVLANHARFNGSVLLGSLAYDVALSVREAQVFGVSVRQYNSQFQVGYGVHFEGNTSYSLFADTDKNKFYDVGTDTIIRTYTLQRGFRVQEFCGILVSGVSQCSTDSSNPLTHLAVVFIRPEPDASMTSNEPGVLYSRATITVVSAGGDTRTIEVASTGQISVRNP